MEKIKVIADFKKNYLEKKGSAREGKAVASIRIIFCLLIYFLAIFLQIRLSSLSNVGANPGDGIGLSGGGSQR